MFKFSNYRLIRSEIKNNLNVSIPLIASQLIYACSNFIGTALLAHLGKDALAASVLVSMIWISLSVLFFGMLNSVSVLVSHQHGAKNEAAISRLMGQAFILGVVLCVMMILVFFTIPLFFRFSAQPQSVIDLARIYMHAILWTIPGLVALVIGEQFLAGIDKAKIVLRMSMIVVPIEIPLIYCFIYGKFGFPLCGVAGVGYGFAVSYTLTALALLLYLYKNPFYKKYGIFRHILEIHWPVIKEFIRVGVPMGFMHLIEVSTFAMTTLWIAHFGTTLLAVHQIVLQYLGFTITIVFAMSQAVTVRVGHSVGRQDLSGIHYAIYVGMMMNFVCMLIIALFFYFAPQLFLFLDINIHDPANAELFRSASQLLAIGAVLLIFDNFRIVGFGALRGLKDTRFPMFASLVSFWVVGLSSAFIFAFICHWQGKGIWWGLTLGIAVGALIVFARIRYMLGVVDLKKLV